MAVPLHAALQVLLQVRAPRSDRVARIQHLCRAPNRSPSARSPRWQWLQSWALRYFQRWLHWQGEVWVHRCACEAGSRKPGGPQRLGAALMRALRVRAHAALVAGGFQAGFKEKAAPAR